ncbi:YczE/YyaS/YitT family protein [Exiguobacterium oxidotolerans]|uniref:Uncharacterized protein n=2 Tax=Exiguobacterium oxidotolerans TaxID=223958 RepID=A0A653I392_9BACL|nr:hypothetical protein [Exiguobacterium oxidotolerans]VWX33230.1 conserved membrane hypothetical protein [Exiguobacterium oxidotolerans]
MSQQKRITIYLFSIIINALGNSFMVTAAIGSAPWTSASEALARISPLTVGLAIVCLHIFALGSALALGSRFSWWTIILSFSLVVLFGAAIDFFLAIHQLLYVPSNLVTRSVYMIIGMPMISLGLALYLQIGFVLMPPDYLMKSLISRFKSTTIGATISLAIPFLIASVLSIVEHELIGIGVGTFVFLLLNGPLIEFFQRIFPISNRVKS